MGEATAEAEAHQGTGEQQQQRRGMAQAMVAARPQAAEAPGQREPEGRHQRQQQQHPGLALADGFEGIDLQRQQQQPWRRRLAGGLGSQHRGVGVDQTGMEASGDRRQALQQQGRGGG